jgi:hypothetical protein
MARGCSANCVSAAGAMAVGCCCARALVHAQTAGYARISVGLLGVRRGRPSSRGARGGDAGWGQRRVCREMGPHGGREGAGTRANERLNALPRIRMPAGWRGAPRGQHLRAAPARSPPAARPPGSRPGGRARASAHRACPPPPTLLKARATGANAPSAAGAARGGRRGARANCLARDPELGRAPRRPPPAPGPRSPAPPPPPSRPQDVSRPGRAPPPERAPDRSSGYLHAHARRAAAPLARARAAAAAAPRIRQG